jgi:hypothetical protein
VVDSLFRRGETTFRHNPAFALDVWLHYNRLLLEFATRNPEVTLVCEAAQAVANPRGLCDSIRQRLHVPIGDPPDCYDDSLLLQDGDAGRPALLAAMCPESITLYRQLQELTGAPADGFTAPTPLALRGHLLAEWQRSAVHGAVHGDGARGHRGPDQRRSPRGGDWRRRWPLSWWQRPPPRRAA